MSVRGFAQRHCVTVTADDQRVQASGRFFATPVRRGNPGGVGPVLRIASRPSGASSSAPADQLGNARDPVRLRRLADPEDDEAALADEREAPLGRGRGWASAFATATPNCSGSCSSARPQVTVDVRELGRPRLEEPALAALRLEQGHAARAAARPRAGSRACRRPSRRRRSARPCRRRAPSARSASSHEHRAGDARDRGSPSGPGVEITAASQRSRIDGCTPGSVRGARGSTTTNRFGSLPSLDVSTSGSSFSSSWTIRRSTAVIGSSSTR